MRKNTKNTPTVRIVLLCCFVILFLFIGIVFVYQYGQYRALEKRLTEAYQGQQADSDNLNYLFSTYSETENTFRLYTLDFNDSTYHVYVEKLNGLKNFVDSLNSLPLASRPLSSSTLKVADQQKIALEFASLKMRLDQLVFHSIDSLVLVSRLVNEPAIAPKNLEPAIDKPPIDTIEHQSVDTIIRKKQGLFKRIFYAKDDTIVISSPDRINKELTSVKEDVAVDKSQLHDQYEHQSSLNQLRSTFLALREKERQLIATNLDLLNSLKESVEIIRSLNSFVIRKAEQNDFSLYKNNINVFGLQLIFALSLMLVMIGALIYYQLYATSYERRLHVEKDYAAKLAEEKTSVLANISHEIRTPLNSLLGIIDLLKNRTKTNEIDVKLVDSAYYSINVISNNITDILSLSKLEASNKGNIALDYFSPHRAFQEVVALHKNQAELKKLRMRVEIDIDPRLSIQSNEFRIKQIASNFLSNAIKYTPKGEIKFQASLSDSRTPPLLHIEVADSGIGIREEDHRQVFRKYFTANAHSGGIGLGLYITKIMAEELGGIIGVRSKLGKGSVFFADVPFSGSKLDAEAQRNAKLSDLPSDLRLLVVDDNPINILFMKQFFKDIGHINTASNGDEALAYLLVHPVDVVLTDINMPGMSGVQLLEKIRSNERFNSIKVLAFSADMPSLKYLEENKAEAFFDGFIEKPFTEAEIVKTILKALT